MTPPARAASRYASTLRRPAIKARRPRRSPRTPPATRKRSMSPAEVLAAHRQIAAEFGNQADQVVAEARQRGHGQAEERSPDKPRNSERARPSPLPATGASSARPSPMNAPSSAMPCGAAWAKPPIRRSAPASRRGLRPASFRPCRDKSMRRDAVHHTGRPSRPSVMSFARCSRGRTRLRRSCRFRMPSRSPRPASISTPRSAAPSNRYLPRATRFRDCRE